VLQQVFSDIGSGGKLFVETGAGDGSFASCRHLKASAGWNGMNVDASLSSSEDGFVETDMGSFDGFGDFLQNQGTPKELDLLVLRTGNDFALWVSASLADIRPRVVLATFHSGFGAEKALVASELSSTDSLGQSGSTGPGCSLAAITWLARQLEYLCVHVDRLGLYVVCIDNTEAGRIAGAKEHWNNAVLLWRVMEFHPDTSNLPPRQWISPEEWMVQQGLALQ
jgi:hypothetical protein